MLITPYHVENYNSTNAAVTQNKWPFYRYQWSIWAVASTSLPHHLTKYFYSLVASCLTFVVESYAKLIFAVWFCRASMHLAVNWPVLLFVGGRNDANEIRRKEHVYATSWAYGAAVMAFDERWALRLRAFSAPAVTDHVTWCDGVFVYCLRWELARDHNVVSVFASVRRVTQVQRACASRGIRYMIIFIPHIGKHRYNWKCGPNVMAALPNIGGALAPSVERRNLADAHY